MLLPIPTQCEVAIIGGGLAGLFCALFLAEAGVDVVLVDSGEGASVSSLGLVQVGTPEHPHRLAAALGLARAKQYLHFSQRSGEVLRAHAQVVEGGLRVGMGEEIQELEEAVRVSNLLGLPSELWSAQRVQDALDCQGLGPARFVPQDARLDPVQVLANLRTSAQAAGARMVRARVVRVVDGLLHLEAQGLRTLSSEIQLFAASWGLRALEPWFQDKLHPVRAAGLETAARGRPPGQGASAQHGYLSWQSSTKGGLRVSGARWATPHMEAGETQAGAGAPKVQAALDRFVAQHFPQDAAAGVVMRWSGVQGYTCDNLPIVGPLPGGRQVACAGFADSGWSMAPGAARAVVDGILGGAPEIPRFLQPIRFLA